MIPLAVLAKMSPRSVYQLIQSYNEMELIRAELAVAGKHVMTTNDMGCVVGKNDTINTSNNVSQSGSLSPLTSSSRAYSRRLKRQWQVLQTEYQLDDKECATDTKLPKHSAEGESEDAETETDDTVADDTMADDTLELPHDVMTRLIGGDEASVSREGSMAKSLLRSLTVPTTPMNMQTAPITETSQSVLERRDTANERRVAIRKYPRDIPHDTPTLSTALTVQRNVERNDKNMFVCNMINPDGSPCTLKYKSKTSVYRHWAARHDIQGPLKCRQCPKRFWATPQLANHENDCI